MADRIIHRGPDDADYYVDDQVSLGFRRLSIIDLEGGRQPILNEDGTKVALMDNDAAVKAARFLYDLKFKYGVLPEESMALVGTEVRNQFIEGNIAIASMDAKSGTVLTDAGVNWDFIPSLEDETRATWIASDALIMNSASQNKELAAASSNTSPAPRSWRNSTPRSLPSRPSPGTRRTTTTSASKRCTRTPSTCTRCPSPTARSR